MMGRRVDLERVCLNRLERCPRCTLLQRALRTDHAAGARPVARGGRRRLSSFAAGLEYVSYFGAGSANLLRDCDDVASYLRASF